MSSQFENGTPSLREFSDFVKNDLFGGPLPLSGLDFGSLGPIDEFAPLDASSDPKVATGDLADLVKMLSATTPDAATKADLAPMPQNVGVIPYDDIKNAGPSYNYLVQMASLSQLYTAIYSLNAMKSSGRTQPWKISVQSEAQSAICEIADAAYAAFLQPLAGFYTITSNSQSTFEKTMRKSEVHLEFLTEIFKGFNLGPAALGELDGILTTFVKSLSNIQIENNSKKSTVNHTLRINQVRKQNISGDEANPIWVYQPTTRLVYMQIDNSTFRNAVSAGKNSGFSEGLDFTMRTVTVDADLNVDLYLQQKPKLDKIFQSLIGKNLEVFGGEICPKPVEEKK